MLKKSEMFQSGKLSEFHQYIRDNPELYHPVGYAKLINLGFYKKIYGYRYCGDFNLD